MVENDAIQGTATRQKIDLSNPQSYTGRRKHARPRSDMGISKTFIYPDTTATVKVFILDRPQHTTQAFARDQQSEKKFKALAEQWRRDTEHVSFVKKACMHRAYQQIIGMGRDAIPLLLRELQQNPDHWFWALNAITGEDPAQSEDTFDGAVKAWLTWGKENGYL